MENQAVNELKQQAAQFNERTKALIKGCTFAAMNVSPTGQLIDVWGDFRSRKAAKEAMAMWRILKVQLGGQFSFRMEGKKIRVMLDFNA